MEDVWKHCQVQATLNTQGASPYQKDTERMLATMLADIEATFCGEVTIYRKDILVDAEVTFTVIHHGNAWLLFCEDSEHTTSKVAVNKLYLAAKQYWELHFPNVAFPPQEGYRVGWELWVFELAKSKKLASK